VLLIWSNYGIAKEHNLYVIEDNAQAIGANCSSSFGPKESWNSLVM
jgi:hypothetical protein